MTTEHKWFTPEVAKAHAKALREFHDDPDYNGGIRGMLAVIDIERLGLPTQVAMARYNAKSGSFQRAREVMRGNQSSILTVLTGHQSVKHAADEAVANPNPNANAMTQLVTELRSEAAGLEATAARIRERADDLESSGRLI